MQEVLKREVVEGEKADEARKKINRAASKQLRAKKVKQPNDSDNQTETNSDDTDRDNAQPEI